MTAPRSSWATDPMPDELDRRRNLGTGSHDDPLEIKERESVVAAALAELNSDQRAALVLVCASGTGRSRRARGRARLVPLLTDLERAGE